MCKTLKLFFFFIHASTKASCVISAANLRSEYKSRAHTRIRAILQYYIHCVCVAPYTRFKRAQRRRLYIDSIYSYIMKGICGLCARVKSINIIAEEQSIRGACCFGLPKNYLYIYRVHPLHSKIDFTFTLANGI